MNELIWKNELTEKYKQETGEVAYNELQRKYNLGYVVWLEKKLLTPIWRIY